MIRNKDNVFEITTKNTSYIISVLDTGQLEHLYYGKKIKIHDNNGEMPLIEKHIFPPGNTNQYDAEHKNFSLEDICLEMSSYGKGDIREPFIELIHADGSITTDFVYEDYCISKGKKEFETLPGSYDENDNVDHLTIILKDRNYNETLELHYFAFEDSNVITRSAKLINTGGNKVRIKRLMSCQIDYNYGEFNVTNFTGGWAREMKKTTTSVRAGKFVNSTYAGTSSSRANPFIMLSKENVSENYGECYGLNLIYSGNHYEAVEVSGFGKTRVVTGINPQSFEYILEPGECFEAPEAVMTYSNEGFNGMSQNFHKFVRENIVRGEWKKKERPVLLNSWEAAYFDINEKKLLKLAKAGKEAGIELFVMDDGWFGERYDDTSSLGDWYVNKKKLPNGLSGLAKKINDMGLMFGIWVEPEMVNVNSNLYREHRDWVLEIPNVNHTEGRNQRILDLGNSDVTEFIIERMSEIFESANISYVKWDMNRIFSDIFSINTAADKQGEIMHRYYIGLYRCMKELTERFPHILFEGCSGGGNRFDLGILSYFPQIWASDDTDALCRGEMQHNYSYGYPMSVVSAHVSACPNHQTLRVTPLETRFNVAAFGVCGYECNLSDMTNEERQGIKAQIELYKKWRKVLQYGSFYRGRTYGAEQGYTGVLRNTSGNVMEWTVVSQDKTKAVGMLMQRLVVPNTQFEKYKATGLCEDKLYHFYNCSMKYNIKEFGDLVNTVAPIHIKMDSIVHNLVAKYVKIPGETEDLKAYGDLLMYNGVNLKQAFAATGLNDQVRHFRDFGSRMYFMEEI